MGKLDAELQGSPVNQGASPNLFIGSCGTDDYLQWKVSIGRDIQPESASCRKLNCASSVISKPQIAAFLDYETAKIDAL